MGAEKLPNISGATGAVLSAGANVGANTLAYLQNRKLMNEQNEYNRKMYARQRSDYLVDRAHDEQYNTPAMQKARMRNAGMNPLQFMGDPVATSSATNGASLAPSVGADTTPLANMGNTGAIAFNSMLTQSSVVKNLADAKKTGIESGVLSRTAEDVVRNMRLQGDKTFQEIENFKAVASRTAAETKNYQLKNELMERTIPLTVTFQELQNALAGEDLTTKSINNEWLPKEKQKGLEELNARVDEIKSRAGLNRATTAKTKSETATIDAMREVNFQLATANLFLTYAQQKNVNMDIMMKRNEYKWMDKEHQQAYEQTAQAIKNLRREYKWMPVKNVCGCLKDVGVGIGSLAGGASSILKALPLPTGPAPVTNMGFPF